MMAMTAGVTRAGIGMDGIAWNILGQTYKPLQLSERSFAFDTLFPPGTFVPPHVHPMQDEFIRVLEGTFDLRLDGQAERAGAGDLIRLPMGQPHGIFNNSGAPVRAVLGRARAASVRAVHAAARHDGRGGGHQGLGGA